MSEKLIEKEAKRAAKEKADKPEIPGIGHNTGEVSGERLKSFIQRIESLSEEKTAIGEDIKDVFTEVKSAGFDAAITRKIVALRKMPLEKRREQEELIELYKAAIGLE